MSVSQKMEARLRAVFSPQRLEVRDMSAAHRGHAGAAEGGHYEVTIESTAFQGLSLVDRHRLVNEALKEFFGAGIHALALKTFAPGEG